MELKVSKLMLIEHINIRAPKQALESEKVFFCNVFGLTEGFRPDFPRYGYWLYSGKDALVHLTECDKPRTADNVGHLDHIAFSLCGLADFVSALERASVIYTLNKIPEFGITQVFFKSPLGIGLEANFANEQG